MQKQIIFILGIMLLAFACNGNQLPASGTPFPAPTMAVLADAPATDGATEIPTKLPTKVADEVTNEATAEATPHQIYLPTVTIPDNTYYVAADGSDEFGNGRVNSPWRTITYAVNQVPDTGIILVEPGMYIGQVALSRKFTSGITIRSLVPYRAQLRHTDKVLYCFECAGVTVEGFDIAHSGPGAGQYVIQIQDTADNGTGGRDLQFINNILHDSYNNDIVKVNNGARNILFADNIFYNQYGEDSHIDINSALNVTLRNNIFFNDFAASGRSDTNTGSFIVIKDSNGNEDGILGSQHITLDGNIFANWEGGIGNAFIALGDSSQVNYYFASDVVIQNNLFMGNAAEVIHTTLKIVGSSDVVFRNNTVTGDLPSKSFAFRLTTQALPNRNIAFYNNIWADPTGTMGAENSSDVNNFADTESTESHIIFNNLYWNGGADIPGDDNEQITYLQDTAANLSNPNLPTDQSTFLAPVWLPANGQFVGGFTAIDTLFDYLVANYCAIPAGSAAIDAANPQYAPATDILGNGRSTTTPDLGAYERP